MVSGSPNSPGHRPSPQWVGEPGDQAGKGSPDTSGSRRFPQRVGGSDSSTSCYTSSNSSEAGVQEGGERGGSSSYLDIFFGNITTWGGDDTEGGSRKSSRGRVETFLGTTSYKVCMFVEHHLPANRLVSVRNSL